METYLAMDIGAGTQDILLYEKGARIENCMKLVAPTRAVILARRVEELTARGEAIFLKGHLMGSRFLGTAVKKHIAAGYRVYASPGAAKTFRDNPDQVRSMGIEICDEPPGEMPHLELGDIDLRPIHALISSYDKPLPSRYFVAVQDHGECLEGSNRKVRIDYFREFLYSGGDLKSLLFPDIPPLFTRMREVRAQIPGSFLMDTGPAALMGSLYDPVVRKMTEEGVILVNLGNQHMLAALVKQGRVFGIMEHHTALMDEERIASLIERFRQGELTHDEVFEEKGHGCAIHPEYEKAFEFVSVTGPQRHLANSLGYHHAASFGDMMLTGCFGLLGAAGLIDTGELAG